jgi:Tol biopolymer transport system component
MPEQLTSEVSWYPEVSPDGKLIACTLLDSGAAGEGVIAVIPITGGAPIRRVAGIPASSRVRWGPRGETLTYVRTEHNVSNLFARGVFDSTQQQLTQFETDQIFAFDWSRDRSRLAIVRGVESRNAVMLPASRKIDGRN